MGVTGRSGRGQYWVMWGSLGGQGGVSTGSCGGHWEVREGSKNTVVNIKGRHYFRMHQLTSEKAILDS